MSDLFLGSVHCVRAPASSVGIRARQRVSWISTRARWSPGRLAERAARRRVTARANWPSCSKHEGALTRWIAASRRKSVSVEISHTSPAQRFAGAPPSAAGAPAPPAPRPAGATRDRKPAAARAHSPPASAPRRAGSPARRRMHRGDETLESSRRSVIRRNRSRCCSSRVCNAAGSPPAAAASSDSVSS